MCPPVHGYPGDIPRRIKTPARQHSLQLIAYVPFERLEGRAKKLITAHAVLIPPRLSRLARHAQHEEHHWLLRFARRSVFTYVHWKVEHGERVIGARREDLMSAQ